jgi:hypothetical protein
MLAANELGRLSGCVVYYWPRGSESISLCYADRRRCHRLHHLSSSLTSKSTGINGCGVFRAKLLCNVHKICVIKKVGFNTKSHIST